MLIISKQAKDNEYYGSVLVRGKTNEVMRIIRARASSCLKGQKGSQESRVGTRNSGAGDL